MVMSRSTAVGSIICGSIMLGFAIITVICGAISASKMSGKAASSVGLWSLFYGVPGILTIVAGASKNGVVMGFALFFNIMAVIVSAVASIVLIIFAALLRKVLDNFDTCLAWDDGSQCKCFYDDGSESVTWDVKCSDIDTINSIIIAMVVLFAILTITSFIASIFGCLGTCCVPIDPVVVVTPGVPVHAGGTVVVQSNQSSMHSAYPGYPTPYSQPPLPAYGDQKSLVHNMAI